MFSAVERYQLRLRAALARYFPRTTAYLPRLFGIGLIYVN